VQCPPRLPRKWDDDEKVCRCPRCREKIPLDDVGDDCSDNESDNDDYAPGADGGIRRKRAETSASADDDDKQVEPAEGGNQPKRVKVAANNVTNRVVDWVRV
jgi:hypothetical protein